MTHDTQAFQLFRAVPFSNVDPYKRHTRVASLRAPSNVPYLVDNIWEFLRPAHMPSRRHAAYASPTPALAMRNASAFPNEGELYNVCELQMHGEVKLAHMKWTDARHHPDITVLRHTVTKLLTDNRVDWEDRKTRLAYGPLFMPWLRPEDIREELIPQLPLVGKIMERAREVSTLWKDVTPHVNPEFTGGELFFELVSPDAYYTLCPY